MKQRLRDLEARENWIQARIDELMDDGIWRLINHEYYGDKLKELARKEAEREYTSLMADLEEALIDSGVYA